MSTVSKFTDNRDGIHGSAKVADLEETYTVSECKKKYRMIGDIATGQ